MRKLLTLLLLLQTSIYADNYALIIGVDGNGLVGASNDALMMQTLLIGKNIQNITLLKNQDATKQRIVESFATMTQNAQEGDYVYLFFSGHGTNEHDPNISDTLKKELKDTGALMPYGVTKIDYNSLVVIKRDLVKYFKALDKKRSTPLLFLMPVFQEAHSKSLNPKKAIYHSTVDPHETTATIPTTISFF